MGGFYNLPPFSRDEMMMLQSVVASEDPEVREAAGRNFADMWRCVQQATGAPDEEVWDFFGAGMMLSVDATVGLMSRLEKEA